MKRKSRKEAVLRYWERAECKLQKLNDLRAGRGELTLRGTRGRIAASRSFALAKQDSEESGMKKAAVALLCFGLLLFNKPIQAQEDRKSTRLNSSHSSISYAVFCLKKKKKKK